MRCGSFGPRWSYPEQSHEFESRCFLRRQVVHALVHAGVVVARGSTQVPPVHRHREGLHGSHGWKLEPVISNEPVSCSRLLGQII